MTELKGKIFSLQYALDGKALLTLEIEGNAKKVYEQFKDKALTVSLKLFRKKRSTDANALCWKLCTEIADELRAGKDEVYIRMLKRYGQSAMVNVKSEIDVTGYFKYFDVVSRSTFKGINFTHYIVYKGSSEYDTREMSIFLDGIVSEAENLGIEVLTERELSLLKDNWN